MKITLTQKQAVVVLQALSCAESDRLEFIECYTPPSYEKISADSLK